MNPPSDETLFAEVLARPTGERAAYLDQACAGDAALRARLESLLRVHDQATGFLEKPVASDARARRRDSPAPPPTAAAPPAAARVHYFGDYELLAEIARGGMGVVWKARQVGLNRLVALKMIRSGALASDDEVKRFHVEAEAAANLQHPNIVAIHEVGVHEGQHYYSMDYVEGQDLARLAGGQPMEPRRAAQYVKSIAEAIHFAHQRGTLHRDLKPQNIMVDTRDQVRITDFGLARQTQRDSGLTETGLAMGSPSYMPPEQVQGRRDLVGPASDVYALGAVLYELLTGRPPFHAASALDTLNQVLTAEPAAPSRRVPGIPRDAETICLKCLEKDPTRRYHSARELAEELGRFLEGEPIVARRANPLRRIVAWLRRHPGLLAVAITTLLVVLAGVAYGLWEKTQYLAWLNAHPGHIQAKGPLTAQAKGSPIWLVSWWVALLYVFHFLHKQKRVFTYEERVAHPHLPRHRLLPRRWAVFFVFSGSVGVISVLYLAAIGIKAFVWEGYFSVLELWFLFYMFLYGSVDLLADVVREQGAELLGLRPSPKAESALKLLAPEKLAQIREELFAGRFAAAVQIYRECTGAKRDETGAILDLYLSLKRTDPKKFADYRTVGGWCVWILQVFGLIVWVGAVVLALAVIPQMASKSYWLLAGWLSVAIGSFLLLLGIASLTQKPGMVGAASLFGAALFLMFSYEALHNGLPHVGLEGIVVTMCFGGLLGCNALWILVAGFRRLSMRTRDTRRANH